MYCILTKLCTARDIDNLKPPWTLTLCRIYEPILMLIYRSEHRSELRSLRSRHQISAPMFFFQCLSNPSHCIRDYCNDQGCILNQCLNHISMLDMSQPECHVGQMSQPGCLPDK